MICGIYMITHKNLFEDESFSGTISAIYCRVASVWYGTGWHSPLWLGMVRPGHVSFSIASCALIWLAWSLNCP